MLDQAVAPAAKAKGSDPTKPSASESSCTTSSRIEPGLASLAMTCTASPPNRAAQKKVVLKPSPVIGAKAGTPDAVALCRGVLPKGMVWDYFQPSPADVASKSQRPFSVSRVVNSLRKSVCLVSGRIRQSSIQRNLPVVSASSAKQNVDQEAQPVHLPPIVPKEMAEKFGRRPSIDSTASTAASESHDFGRRPSIDSTVSAQ